MRLDVADSSVFFFALLAYIAVCRQEEIKDLEHQMAKLTT